MLQKVKLQFKATPEQIGMRIDQLCADQFKDYSRMQFKHWIESGELTVDGKTTASKYRIKGNEWIELNAEIKVKDHWQAQAIALAIAYEDEDLLIINKPAGLVVHPGAGNPDQTLLNALLHFDPKLATLPRAGIIHRLDKDTSGLLCIARTAPSYQRLNKMMQAHEIQREYLALVQGKIISGSSINADIGRHPQKRTQMAVIPEGKTAVTHYRIEKRFPAHTLLRIQLETGRTHQIRVHMAHIGHPLVGDKTYGKRAILAKNLSPEAREALQNCPRQMLHATQLELRHPIKQKTIKITAALPEDFQQLLALLSSP